MTVKHKNKCKIEE